MLRREFLCGGAGLAAAAALPRGARAELPFTPRADAWRKFEVTTRVEIVKPATKAQAWLPLPAVAEPGGGQAAAAKHDRRRGGIAESARQ